jgi:glycyl-tRNA synthetase
VERARGIANRTDYDLKAHSRSPRTRTPSASCKYFDQEQKKHIVPYVIEPSAGADRATLAFLCDAYDESLVKEPPAEESQAARAGAELRQVGRQEGPEAVRARGEGAAVAAAEKIAAGLPGTLPELLALSDDEDANQHRGVQEGARRLEKLGEEFTRTVLHLHPRWRRSRSPSSR